MHRLVSHELKTPLAAISGFGEMLQTYDVSESELHRVAGLIAGEADRLGEMVRAFLDLERLDTAFQEADRTSIDIASLVRERTEVLASAASSRLQTISLSVSSSAQIIGVEQLLSQLIDNLVGNALKFSPDRSEVRVEVIPCDDTKVQISVSDTGPGIPSKSIPHLFERFYRVPGSKPSGSGLGLALVRETADAHGATVHVESAEGAGTTFAVIFPTVGESE
jgi:signal transduction histidine kinase